jgi:hypothetical protein
VTLAETEQPDVTQAPTPPIPLSAAERGRRNLAIVIGVTVAVLVFGLLVFAWMYWLAPLS